MKIALVHDALCDVGGAERVFQYMCEEFDEADIYSTCFRPKKTLKYFKTRKINVTGLNPIILNSSLFRISFLISIYALRKIDFSDYDIVISSSASVAKYINVNSGKHYSYCYYPTRAIWEFEKYFQKSKLKYLIKFVLPILKKLDFGAAQNVDSFIAISKDTRHNIKKYYNRNSSIIYCPIDAKFFYPRSKTKEDHYLIVSRLVKWKKIDHAIEAFNKIKEKLVIIGTGEEEKALRKIANPNVEFRGYVGDKELAEEYAKAKAVIFTPHLEYGLIPLEANASGTPVIAFGYGGINETMIPHEKNVENATAVFYYEQTAESLIAALNKFNNIQFDPKYLIDYAAKWDIEPFKTRFRKLIKKKDAN